MGAAGSAAAQQLPDLPEVALDLGAPNWGACAAAAADALDGVVKVQQALGEGKAAQAAAVSYVGGMVSRRSTNQVMSFVVFTYSMLRRSCQSNRVAAALECVRWLAGQGGAKASGDDAVGCLQQAHMVGDG
ncbi:hypothetical protein MNEG_11359 [Monoraphidium neglectum]|uniref:Uncharacterized protein n=1 Tax=Monoraphidium neglectum TaxID=145388 RepID=A0A0D2MPM1_9CHLO|nr:hypothetical protein MNEG_11359 [Monoraphidium neglectum]KIY96605.1 hypothetical protein MNEG_11359 [Monoraphidium neglectum]|eukprot:XP_013895625.1 hypothetical protein MNEG_11359 [Monoraphidium neglectum]